MLFSNVYKRGSEMSLSYCTTNVINCLLYTGYFIQKHSRVTQPYHKKIVQNYTKAYWSIQYAIFNIGNY